MRPPGRENARDILPFSHLGAILPHLVADLVHRMSSYAHLGPSWLMLANLSPCWDHLGLILGLP